MARGEEGFEHFVAGSAASLLRSAYLLTGDREQAEDLLQGTLLRTARRWHAARRAPEAYARRVLINLFRDQWRRSQRRVDEAPPVEVSVETDLADVVVGREAVISALRQLPARQREVLVLRFYSDLSVAETAAAIGASEGTVKSYTSRALARMRVLLADSMEVGNAH